MMPSKEPILEAYKLAIKTLEQEPCDKCVYSTKDGYCQYDDITETIPPLKPCDEFESITPEEMQKCKDIVKKYTPKQEPCDDAISREDAEQMFRNIRSHLKPQDYKSAEEFNTRDLMLLNAEQMIHALPSVTQKYGKWIIIDDCEQFIAKCSECGRIEDSRMISKYPYCHCGAKMQESEE
jgi:hypothetical protein